MTFAYPRNTGASAPNSLPLYNPKRSQSPNLISRVADFIPPVAKQWLSVGGIQRRLRRAQEAGTRVTRKNFVKSVFSIQNAIVLLWMLSIRWGERTVFDDHIKQCLWDSWEEWPQDAIPHHIAFIADPQLVDPHTYPGRPWPLSTLTMRYTDQYMRRSFSLIQDHLEPDSVLFLGDLFDGGREWATATSSSPEARWKGYKDSYWKKEFGRFVKNFLNPWEKYNANTPPVDGRGRRLLANLPGNHDLGFGNGVQEPVRDRFESFFGNTNQVNVIGNHTFVSVDSVSLSAMDQPDPLTGSSPTASDDNQAVRPIWKEADDFLNKMALHRAKAETEELRILRNQSEGHVFDHRVVDAVEPTIHKVEPVSAGFPTILLTHVPLYRKPGTPCGPLRERYPPSSDEELQEDDRNALSISSGYQYQNVLTQTVSNEVVSKAGPNVVQVYSGDDHDYCEISHREFNGSPNEITVKSISWAMGVRRPGFLLTSLWHPIDPQTGKALQEGTPTIQNHLCLLPDQLGIFIYYLIILGISISLLVLHSIYSAFSSPQPSNDSILPLADNRHLAHQYHTSGASSSTMPPGSLASRGMTASARYPEKAPEAYRVDDDEYQLPKKGGWRPASTQPRSRISLMFSQLGSSIRYVAALVLTVYFVLIWRW